jgi:hypothetical protein
MANLVQVFLAKNKTFTLKYILLGTVIPKINQVDNKSSNQEEKRLKIVELNEVLFIQLIL